LTAPLAFAVAVAGSTPNATADRDSQPIGPAIGADACPFDPADGSPGDSSTDPPAPDALAHQAACHLPAGRALLAILLVDDAERPGFRPPHDRPPREAA